VEALGKIGDDRAVEPLYKLHSKCDYCFRKITAQSLAEIGEPAIRHLINLLEDENKDVRISAAGALGKIRNAKAINPLIHSLEDKESDVLAAAIWALGEIGDKRAVEPLIDISSHYEDNVAECAVASLLKLGDLRAIDRIMDWVLYEFRIEDDTRKALRAFLLDYTDLFIDSAFVKCTSVTTDPESKYSSGEYEYDFDEAEKSIAKLCDINTPISSNILHKIAKRKNVTVQMTWTNCDFPGSKGVLSFRSQRQIARAELKRRGDPPYDPSVYLSKEAFKLCMH